MIIKPYYRPVVRVDESGVAALLRWLNRDEASIRSVRAWFNWGSLLRRFRLRLAAAAIDSVESEDDVGMPKLEAALTTLQTQAENATQVNVLQRTIFRDQIADRTSTIHEALVHLTNCVNGRAQQAVLEEAGTPTASPRMAGRGVHRNNLGLRPDDFALHDVFSGPPILPVSQAAMKRASAAVHTVLTTRARDVKQHPQALRERHLLRQAHLQRVAAIAPFVPVGDVWSTMSLKARRQALAEVVEFALLGTLQHDASLHVPADVVREHAPEPGEPLGPPPEEPAFNPPSTGRVSSFPNRRPLRLSRFDTAPNLRARRRSFGEAPSSGADLHGGAGGAPSSALRPAPPSKSRSFSRRGRTPKLDAQTARLFTPVPAPPSVRTSPLRGSVRSSGVAGAGNGSKAGSEPGYTTPRNAALPPVSR